MLAIHYPNAVWDEAEQRLISDAEIAEVPFTAFTSRRTAEHISGRLIVRRVKRLNPTAKTATSAAGGDRQGELFALYRYHAVFTDSPLPLVQAEKTHRAHAIIEQVHADLRSGPLAHLPSGSFAANSAWLVLAAIAFNLTSAAGCLASAFHAKATTGTIRAQLINIPARLARSARRLRMHLPQHWPWGQAWSQLFQATLAPPPTGLTRPPADRPNRNRSGKAGQTGPAGTPTPGVKIRTPSQTRSNVAWCIQAKGRHGPKELIQIVVLDLTQLLSRNRDAGQSWGLDLPNRIVR